MSVVGFAESNELRAKKVKREKRKRERKRSTSQSDPAHVRGEHPLYYLFPYNTRFRSVVIIRAPSR